MVYVLLLRVWKNILMFRSSNLFGRSLLLLLLWYYTHETIESNRSFKTIVTSVLCVVLSGTRRRTKKKIPEKKEEKKKNYICIAYELWCMKKIPTRRRHPRAIPMFIQVNTKLFFLLFLYLLLLLLFVSFGICLTIFFVFVSHSPNTPHMPEHTSEPNWTHAHQFYSFSVGSHTLYSHFSLRSSTVVIVCITRPLHPTRPSIKKHKILIITRKKMNNS